MTHDDVRTLAAEYALGMLDAQELASVDAHLATCAECRALIAQERRVLDALARAVPQVAPPASLRARVLAEASRASVAGASGAASRPARRPRVARAWLIAASVLLMTAAGAWQILSTRDRTRDTERAEQARAMAVVAAEDLVRFDLSSPDASARARALWSRRHGMVFSAEGLAPLPAGRTYQLWVISRGTPISAGVFDIAADGRARVVLATPDSLTAVEAVAVTVEPAGGVPAPSTTPVLAGAASTTE